MKITNEKQLNEFLTTVDKCEGKVYLKSIFGDCYCLKSPLCKYVAIAALLQDEDQSLELFCESHNDEALFYELFKLHPEILGNAINM